MTPSPVTRDHGDRVTWRDVTRPGLVTSSACVTSPGSRARHVNQTQLHGREQQPKTERQLSVDRTAGEQARHGDSERATGVRYKRDRQVNGVASLNYTVLYAHAHIPHHYLFLTSCFPRPRPFSPQLLTPPLSLQLVQPVAASSTVFASC